MPGRYTRIVRFLPRRVLSFALVVCFACTPSALLACAVICVPGMMSHGAMLDAAPVAAASGHEHMHHAMPAPAAASARAASHHDSSHHAETVAPATVVASSTDAIGPGCCTHQPASAGASTRASRADAAAVAAPATSPVFVTLPPARVVAVRAALNGHGFPSPPTHAPIVLRI